MTMACRGSEPVCGESMQLSFPSDGNCDVPPPGRTVPFPPHQKARGLSAVGRLHPHVHGKLGRHGDNVGEPTDNPFAVPTAQKVLTQGLAGCVYWVAGCCRVTRYGTAWIGRCRTSQQARRPADGPPSTARQDGLLRVR